MKKLLLIFFIYQLSTINCELIFAQNNGIIRGFVYEKKSGEPIPYINVYLLKTFYGTTTASNGYFNISKINPGSYTLMVTSLGYDTIKIPLNIVIDAVITKKIYLTESVRELKAVDILGQREIDRTETQTSLTRISPKQISQIPSIGGESDLMQYLQVLPGVTFTGDQGGQIYIRGGSQSQNEVLLDGMIIYNPFHSIGLFSVFDTDILRDVDVYAGGFGAEFGDRISSVMDIKTRPGNMKRIAGKVEATTFGGNLLLEGPLKKQTDSAEGSSSFILSAKNSYLSRSSKIFYKNVNNDNGLPFDYTDLYGKLTFEGNNGSQFNIFGFNYQDKVSNYNSIADFHWNETGVGANFLVIPGNSPTLIEGVFGYSDYNIGLDETSFTPRSSDITGFNLGLHFTNFIDKDAFKYGIDLKGFSSDFIFENSAFDVIEQPNNSTELGAYFKYKLTRRKFVIEPSIRLQYYATLSAFSPEPRLAVKYNVNNRFRLKFATGIYSQNLVSATYDRDVVNLFYGFIVSPQYVASEINGNSPSNPIQKAQHFIIGAEYDIMQNASFNIEAYYKNYSQLIVLNDYQIYDPTNANNTNKPDYLKDDFITENGYADGVDVSFKYEKSHVYIYGAYSLCFVNLNDGIMNYAPYWDRRHNINIVTSYRFGRALQWEASMRWNLGSGFPYTKTQGVYEKLPFFDGINTDYTGADGSLAFIYDKYDGSRLPYYHRLDLSIKRKFYIGQKTTLDITFSLTNVYDNQNIFYVDRVTGEKIYQLPILPSAGIKFSF